jgi:hypothetical protein
MPEIAGINIKWLHTSKIALINSNSKCLSIFIIAFKLLDLSFVFRLSTNQHFFVSKKCREAKLFYRMLGFYKAEKFLAAFPSMNRELC